MRLDKYLAQMSAGTRSEVRELIKSDRVFVNDVPADKPGQKVGQDDVITVDGEQIVYAEYEYYMLNKPQGYVSAVKDNTAPTVVSLIRSARRQDLFPVGRLDKDTEGLLLITNDGKLAHRLLSPKKHVWKKYLVQAQGLVTGEDIRMLEQGVDIGDGKETLPARAEILDGSRAALAARAGICNGGGVPVQGNENGCTWLELAIREGRYHQIKRMMAAVGKPVIYLKRISMGSLNLDERLGPGEYRALTGEEIHQLNA